MALWRRIKSKVVGLAVIVSCLWAGEVSISIAADPPVRMSLEAELALDTVYWRFEGPKAFAIGPNDVWSYYLGGADPAAYAIEDCNKSLGTSAGDSCVLIARGNDVISPQVTSGVFLWKGTPANTLPFSATEYLNSADQKPKAIIVVLPDCSPCAYRSFSPLLGSPVAQGMTLYSVDLTDLFRNVPKSSEADDNAEQARIRAVKSAVLRTDLTLHMLKSLNPGVPMIVWGDGWGGYLAQLASEKVDGLIMTGSICMPYYRTPAGVETRYLYRESDPRLSLFGDKLDAISASRSCADAAPSFTTEVTVIAKDNNIPIAETTEFKATVTQLLDLIAIPLQ